MRSIGCSACSDASGASARSRGFLVRTLAVAVTHREAKLMLLISQNTTTATSPALANTPDTTAALNRITPNAYAILSSAHRITPMKRSRRRLQTENLFLRHQLNIALRRAPPRLRLHGRDRASLVWMTGICPGLLDLARVVKPETIQRWHRAGFKAF